jgi:NAD(P)H-dependent nitrite reductase small subunit
MSTAKAASGARIAVLDLADLPPGTSTAVEAFDTTVALFNVGGTVHALDNTCPHNGAPLCHGRVGGRLLPSAPHEHRWSDEPVVTCPWHKWQFDLRTGGTLFDPDVAVPVYEATVEDGRIYLAEPRG